MIYLDNAASSHPKPQGVYDAVLAALKIGANPGRSGHGAALSASRIIHDTRSLVAELIGAPDSSRVVFTCNATHALNIAFKGVLREGDEVITSSMEHNSVLRPLYGLEEKGVETVMLLADSEGYIDPAKVEELVTPRTRMVALTHASNVTGTITDIEAIGEICKRKGILFLLDASQTAGVLPIDVVKANVHFLASPGHKGLLGPQGTGILYVSPEVEVDSLMEGGTGFASESRTMPMEMPEKLEAGTLNTPGLAGLGAGIRYLLDEGIENIRKKEVAIVERLLEKLDRVEGLVHYGPREAGRRVAVVPFNLEGIDGAHVGFGLDEGYSIAVRVGLHCAPDAHKTIGAFPQGTVRASFGPFNSSSDADALADAVAQIAKL